MSLVTPDLLRRYDVPGPRYTSYPTADRFVEAFRADDYIVALKQRNIDQLRQRARLVTWWFLNEDRDQVMLELKEFKRLAEAEPKLEMMPGHDQTSLDHFISAGLLVKGFK